MGPIPRMEGEAVPQIQLPIFPEGVTHITNELAFRTVDDQVTYFNGSMPIFIHAVDDTKTFRMITSQFCVNGAAKLIEISKAFGVPTISVKRAVKLYRSEGPAGFFRKKKARKKTVLTPPVLKAAQDLLNNFVEAKDIAQRLNVNPDTLRKAISSGRLQRIEKKVRLTN